MVMKKVTFHDDVPAEDDFCLEVAGAIRMDWVVHYDYYGDTEVEEEPRWGHFECAVVDDSLAHVLFPPGDGKGD